MTSQPDAKSPYNPASRFEPDCAACVGLCCVAPKYSRDAWFPYDKPEGVPCMHLDGDNRCRIHERLADEGFEGCVAYTCYGAGQKITAHMREIYGGRSWRDDPAIARETFARYTILKNMLECVCKLSDTARRQDRPAALEYAHILEAAVSDLSNLPSREDMEGFMHVTQVMIDEIAKGNPLPFGG